MKIFVGCCTDIYDSYIEIRLVTTEPNKLKDFVAAYSNGVGDNLDEAEYLAYVEMWEDGELLATFWRHNNITCIININDVEEYVPIANICEYIQEHFG